MPSVERIKLMAIIVAKMGKNGRRSKGSTFLLKYQRYRDSNQIIIYTVCNRIKSSFDKESLKNTHTDPLTIYL